VIAREQALHAGMPAEARPARTRVAIELAVDGDLRFLSHHDEMRLIRRALVRAGWPLAYSTGFNPKPRLIVPLPRNLGVAADHHLLLVDLNRLCPASDLFDSLRRQLPGGYRLQRVLVLPARAVPQAWRVVYELDLEPEAVPAVRERIERLRSASTLIVQRQHGPDRPPRPVDIRPYVEDLRVNGRRLRMVLACRGQRSARPFELTAVLGLPAEVYDHLLRRAETEWDIELSGPKFGPAEDERNCLGNQED